MKKVNIGIFCSLLLALGFTSCTSEGESKLMLNEVLVDNRTNFQDDYGVHSAWIEIFNKSYGSADLAGCYLKHSSQPGDTAVYFIPKGDVLTKIKPRQHALFWADDKPNRGTFHTNFLLETDKDNWIGLYDSGKKKLDEIVIPAGLLQADQSYARVDDAAAEWEVKDESAEKYVTPSTNNKTLDKNVKMEKFEQHDSIGIGMAITAMAVVFIGLILLYIFFKFIGGHHRPRGSQGEDAGPRPGRSLCSHRHGHARDAERRTRRGRDSAHHHTRQTQLFAVELENLHVARDPAAYAA